jgi:hypothetical protein
MYREFGLLRYVLVGSLYRVSQKESAKLLEHINKVISIKISLNNMGPVRKGQVFVFCVWL